MQLATLCFLVDFEQNRISLANKKRGFGEGKLNGYGGKPNENENILACAVRETGEESGVSLSEEHLEKVAELTFTFPYKPEWNQIVYVYKTEKWTGEPQESEEMKPEWFKFSEIPYHKMWDDDKYWLPKLLAGENFGASFEFGKDNQTIEKHEFYKLDN